MFHRGERSLVRFWSNSSLSRAAHLAAMLLIPMFLIVPQAALAQAHVANCPTEPQQNYPIASGDAFAGSNCILNTPGDVDSFVFSANAGDTYQLALGYQGGGTNVCLTLYDPNSVKIISQTCTSANGIVLEKTLATTGKYTIMVTEPAGGGQAVDAYALSLERINPFPLDAQPITLSKVVNGVISAPTEQDAFTLNGFTTGTYEVSITYTGGGINVCMYLYYPGTITPNALSGCTSANTYAFQFTPPKDDNYMVLVNGAGNDATVSYNLEVTCVLGTCPNKEPTTTTLTSSPNPSADGQSVTFTAVVSSGEGAPPNGETVSFMSGKTVLGTGTLSNGTATFSDSKLTPGATTSVTAVYPGEVNFLASTSNTVKQVVAGPCTLTDSLKYSASTKTLTMKFTVGNTVATTWNIWLTDQNTMEELFSTSEPITTPPESITKTTTLSAEGKVGVLSTLTTPTDGIVCASWVQINTGTP
jgi:hypothetical protein